MESAEIHINSSTVRHRQLEAGRKAKKQLKKHLLSKKMKNKRLRWAKAHKNWTEEEWKKILLLDKSHFFVQESTANLPGSARVNSKVLLTSMEVIKHQKKKMFCGCCSYSGVGSLVPIEGILNSDKYIDVIETKVIPDMRRTFSEDKELSSRILHLVILLKK